MFVFPGLNGRTCWTTLISAFCTLVENEDDRLYVVYNGGLQLTFEVFIRRSILHLFSIL